MIHHQYLVDSCVYIGVYVWKEKRDSEFWADAHNRELRVHFPENNSEIECSSSNNVGNRINIIKKDKSSFSFSLSIKGKVRISIFLSLFAPPPFARRRMARHTCVSDGNTFFIVQCVRLFSISLDFLSLVKDGRKWKRSGIDEQKASDSISYYRVFGTWVCECTFFFSRLLHRKMEWMRTPKISLGSFVSLSLGGCGSTYSTKNAWWKGKQSAFQWVRCVLFFCWRRIPASWMRWRWRIVYLS